MSEDGSVGVIVWVVYLVILILYVLAFWKIFTKAGKPGWASIIPFYNIYILLKIVGRPGWWLVLFFIPLVNSVITLFVALDLAKSFKRSTVFGVVALWLFSFVGYLMLGFGKSTYSGPAVSSAPASPTPKAPAPTPELNPKSS